MRELPWRGDGSGPLDPTRLPAFRGLRPLKRWRYVGVYGPRLQLCVGLVRIAGAPQSFWAVHDRERGAFRERTVLRKAVDLAGDRVLFPGGELRLTSAGDRVEVVSRHGEHPIWTRKTPLRVHGWVDAGGERIEVDAPGLLDESAGYHARVTEWRWSAGCGTTTDGRPVVWNLVDGIHDGSSSERTVWVDGTAKEVPPVHFADDLSEVSGANETLRFTVEEERSRHDRLFLVDSAYRQPFGRFSGVVPGGVELAEGFGVMEAHSVRW
ncbi:DUF2804 family protein [Amycolatopsis sp. 195334CR]|uniref:DUF2804 family protein n=1 Tax=Amycolatopsis sp. 195334CR TaxID=2814588 RepID=UPI001A8E3E5E|nr:DUF2804 family protein [Amycolatopsis sp. 195334CR]MBN6036609.1 DUF2804 family protein [Amycolatopsis sp. 195334CR]